MKAARNLSAIGVLLVLVATGCTPTPEPAESTQAAPQSADSTARAENRPYSVERQVIETPLLVVGDEVTLHQGYPGTVRVNITGSGDETTESIVVQADPDVVLVGTGRPYFQNSERAEHAVTRPGAANRWVWGDPSSSGISQHGKIEEFAPDAPGFMHSVIFPAVEGQTDSHLVQFHIIFPDGTAVHGDELPTSLDQWGASIKASEYTWDRTTDAPGGTWPSGESLLVVTVDGLVAGSETVTFK